MSQTHTLLHVELSAFRHTGSFFFLHLHLSCRGLRFIQVLLQSLADGDRDENKPNLIRVNVIKAYEQALKKYHGWIVQKIFDVRKMSLFLLLLTICDIILYCSGQDLIPRAATVRQPVD